MIGLRLPCVGEIVTDRRTDKLLAYIDIVRRSALLCWRAIKNEVQKQEGMVW